MKTKDYKYEKELADPEVIAAFEAKYNVKLPDDLKLIVKKHNSGRPTASLFDVDAEKDKVFKKLLSFNKEDAENVYTMMNADSKVLKGAIPFGSDPAGNAIMSKDGKVYLWDHETDSLQFLADSASAFIKASEIPVM